MEVHKLMLCFVLIASVTSIVTCCSPNEFECNSGQCVDADVLCDGQVNCTDGSDEIENTCKSLQCPSFAFRCLYGACISAGARCNGVKDCADNSDEMNCN